MQSAFADVSNALIDRVKQNEQLAAIGQQVDALAKYARLARLRYEGGYTSYIEVLDSERQLFAAQLEYSPTLDKRWLQPSISTRRWVAAGSMFPIR